MGGDFKIEDRTTEMIIECIIKVHQILGPGFLESVYRRALLLELKRMDLMAETEKEFIIHYCGAVIGTHRLDLLVEKNVIVELKTVDDLSRAHYAQVRSYLKATKLRVAILVNFAKERADFRRIESPLIS